MATCSVAGPHMVGLHNAPAACSAAFGFESLSSIFSPRGGAGEALVAGSHPESWTTTLSFNSARRQVNVAQKEPSRDCRSNCPSDSSPSRSALFTPRVLQRNLPVRHARQVDRPRPTLSPARLSDRIRISGDSRRETPERPNTGWQFERAGSDIARR